MKRFYKLVTVAEVDDGHVVHLDGKPVRTPAKAHFVMRNRALMEAVAEELDAQVEDIRPHAMPVTQLASTAIDRIPAQREEIVRAVAASEAECSIESGSWAGATPAAPSLHAPALHRPRGRAPVPLQGGPP